MSGGDWKEMLSAVQEGDFALVKYHISNGIDPNYQHPELLTTPLIESVIYGHHAIAAYLLAQGADPALKAGFSNDSPLLEAKKSKDKQMINLIKSYLPKKGFMFILTRGKHKL